MSVLQFYVMIYTVVLSFTSGIHTCSHQCYMVHTSLLQFHVMIHTGEKPYRCDVCGNAYRRRQQLK